MRMCVVAREAGMGAVQGRTAAVVSHAALIMCRVRLLFEG